MKFLRTIFTPFKMQLLCFLDICFMYIAIMLAVMLRKPNIHNIFEYYTGPACFTLFFTTLA